jgi:hypothetical protein
VVPFLAKMPQTTDYLLRLFQMAIHTTNLLCLLFVATVNLSFGQISLNPLSDFEDGTVQSWIDPNSPNPPTNTYSGGPEGFGDNFLEIVSYRGSGPGSGVEFLNGAPEWTGNWTAAGVDFLSFEVNNFSTSSINLRVAVDGKGGKFSSTYGTLIPPSSGWIPVSIPVKAADFSALPGSSSISATLADVSLVKILDHSFPAWRGISSTSLVGFDNFSFGQGSLPLDLVAFEGYCKGSIVVLSWEKQEDAPYRPFFVEHSLDRNDFIEVGSTTVLDSENTNHRFELHHSLPKPGFNFYRLRQTSPDDQVIYSRIIAVFVEPYKEWMGDIYPNPNPEGVLLVDLHLPEDQPVMVGVNSLDGKKLRRYKLEVPPNNRPVRIDISDLSAGTYNLVFDNGEEKLLRRLVLY